MNIMIADDSPSVVEAFTTAIRKLGHFPIECPSLRSATRVINNLGRRVDILFLDNHFKAEGYGIDEIRAFKTARPDLDIVITTKHAVAPELVKQIIDMQVGFSPKEVVDPVRLELEIAQRVNMRLSNEESLRQKVRQLKELAEDSKEGFFRMFQFKGRPRYEVMIEATQRTKELVIVPHFELFQTVNIGQTVEVAHELEIEIGNAIKAATELELGLGLDESVQFFGTKIGMDIKGALKAKFSVTESTRVKGLYRIGQKLCLTESDDKAGIRKREYYRGLLHRVYRVKIRGNCKGCGSGTSAWLKVFVPDKVVEVTVAYDKKGMPLPNEDGRSGYQQFDQ